MSQFLKELTKPTDPFYLRLIKGSNVVMPEFSNRGVFYTGTSGFGGVLTSNTTNPLIDVRDYIYTSGTTSNLDFFGYTFDVPTGVKGKDVAFNFNYKTSTSNFVVVVYALCTSGNKLIYTSQPITIGTSLYEAVFNIPTDCTGLKIGWQYNGTASGETFEYDNIVFSMWTANLANLITQENFVAYGNSGTSVTTATTDIPFIAISENTLNKLGEWLTNTTYKAKVNQQVVVKSKVIYTTANNRRLVIYKNNAITNNSGQTSDSARIDSNITTPITLLAGDYITIREDANGGTLSNDVAHRISITATAISDNVIQSYSNDRVGETIYSIQNTAPQGFISAQGSILGKTTGSHQGEAYKALYDYSWAIASATAGEPYLISSAKGASAQADWDAGKTITIDESGLFTRAYKSGVTNAVGIKQTDAFQGHWHSYKYNANSGGGITDGLVGNASTSGSVMNGPAIKNPISDGTNGTPRTASETRPTNIAKYVYIRYTQSVPTLLALPTSQENVFSAFINANNTIRSTNTDWVASVTTQSTGVKRITFKPGIFTVAPVVISLYGDGGSTYTERISWSVGNQTATYIDIATSGATAMDSTVPFNIVVMKQSPDYKAPGVFVGNVQPEWQYDLTVTGSDWTTTRAVGVVYKMASGQYRMRFNISGLNTSGTNNILTISGVVFKNVNQALSAFAHSSSTCSAATIASTSDLYVIWNISASQQVYLSGDVELNSKPTWAANTP